MDYTASGIVIVSEAALSADLRDDERVKVLTMLDRFTSSITDLARATDPNVNQYESDDDKFKKLASNFVSFDTTILDAAKLVDQTFDREAFKDLVVSRLAKYNDDFAFGPRFDTFIEVLNAAEIPPDIEPANKAVAFG